MSAIGRIVDRLLIRVANGYLEPEKCDHIESNNASKQP